MQAKTRDEVARLKAANTSTAGTNTNTHTHRAGFPFPQIGVYAEQEGAGGPSD
jgi:hypothetical protein